MTKWLVLLDEYGDIIYQLPPLSYDEFLLAVKWGGGSDTEYDAYLRQNGYTDIAELSSEALEGAVIIALNDDGSPVKHKYLDSYKA